MNLATPLKTLPVNANLSAFESGLQTQLKQLESTNLRRYPQAVAADCVSFCDNDYLGLAGDARIISFAAHYSQSGTASRYLGGNHPLYDTLETALARLKGTQAAVVFPNGFAMNQGIIAALAGAEDLILADKLCHASLIDGARHSKATLKRFAHNDSAALRELLSRHRSRYRHVFMVTETVFSMDGDLAPLVEMLALAQEFDCQLIADDAHGLGLLPVPAAQERLIITGTLSKAAASLGGYLCASQTVVNYITATCRPLIYTTALPPMVLAASLKAIEIMEQEDWRGKQALANARQFAAALNLPVPQSAIVPYIIGKTSSAIQASQKLQAKGFYVAAVRPPTVPAGTARLRFTFSARHTPQQLAALIQTLKEITL